MQRTGRGASGTDISIIVMAYNEVATLKGVLDEIEGVMTETSYTYEVIIVDDGSSDGTDRVADVAAHESASTRVVHHSPNLGIGEVYRSGFESAKGEFLTFLPADGQFPASIVAEFAERMGQADLVLGYLPGMKRSFVALALSRIERLLYRCLFGLLPHFQGIMMFRHALLAELGVTLGGRGWGVLMDIIVRSVRSEKVIVSVPTQLRARVDGKSKVNNLRSVRANLVQALALWWSLRSKPVQPNTASRFRERVPTPN